MGMSKSGGGGELSEKAQFSLYCQDSYNAIIKTCGPLPTDKSQISWTGPRFLKVRLLVLLASRSLQSKYSGGETQVLPRSSQSVGWPWVTDGQSFLGVGALNLKVLPWFEELLAYV